LVAAGGEDVERRRALADAHERLGNLELEQLRADEAAARYQQGMEVLAPLVGKDAETPVLKSYAKCKIFLAQSLVLAGRRATGAVPLEGLFARQAIVGAVAAAAGQARALSLFEEAMPLVQNGIILDPRDLEWRRLFFSCRIVMPPAKGGSDRLTAMEELRRF